jgi:DNA-binding transcriptional MerR regulator
MWTMDELVERVRLALTAEYPGAPNGRVRDLPDRRAVRWYTTIGLVDRPAGMRGRTALYGPRHLLQIVAVKRRQAQGATLAQIQAELAGAGDETLAGVARVPEELLAADAPDVAAGPTPTRFWAARAPAPAQLSDPPPPPAHLGDAAPRSARPGGPAPPPARPADPPRAPAAPVGAVALGGGAVLVLPRSPGPADRADIAAAAAPLLDLLAARGLLHPDHDGSPR